MTIRGPKLERGRSGAFISAFGWGIITTIFALGLGIYIGILWMTQ